MFNLMKRAWRYYRNANIETKINIECKIMAFTSLITNIIFDLID